MEFIIARDTSTDKIFRIFGWSKKSRYIVRGRYDDSPGEMELLSIGKFSGVPRKRIDSVHRANSLVMAGVNLKKDYVPTLAKDFKLPIDEFVNGTDIQGCVYKLYYGDRYLVIKAKYLHFSLKLFNDGYNSFHHNPHNHTETSGHAHFYFKMYNYIRKHWGQKTFRVEIVHRSNDPYVLLYTEQIELNAGRKKVKMLNNNITAYIPEKSGWIAPEIVEKFKQKFDL